VTIGAHIFYRWNGNWGDPKSFQRPYVGAEAMAQAWNPVTAADPNVQIVSGVTIHHGIEASPSVATGEDGSMVRIHRAGGGTRPVVVASVAPTDAPPTAGEAVEGVRIHRAGGDSASSDPGTASAPAH
jgi:hypothetical protein